MSVWNSINGTYSNFVLYIATKPHFLNLPRLKAFSVLQCGILSMIDTPFFHYIETKPHFLLLPLFQSIFSMAVWNTIDDRYSNFFLLYRNDA